MPENLSKFVWMRKGHWFLWGFVALCLFLTWLTSPNALYHEWYEVFWDRVLSRWYIFIGVGVAIHIITLKLFPKR